MGGPWRDAGPLRRMRRRHPPRVVGQGGADDEHPSWHWWASPGRGRTWCRARRNTSVPPVWVGAVPATGRGVAGASGLAAAAGAACPPMKATTVHRPHHGWRRGGRRRHRRRPRQRRQIYLFLFEWSGPSMIVHTGCNFVLQLFLLQYFKTDADATNEWCLGQKNSILRIYMDKIQNMQSIYGDHYHMAHVVGNSNLMKINIEIVVTSQALGSN